MGFIYEAEYFHIISYHCCCKWTVSVGVNALPSDGGQFVTRSDLSRLPEILEQDALHEVSDSSQRILAAHRTEACVLLSDWCNMRPFDGPGQKLGCSILDNLQLEVLQRQVISELQQSRREEIKACMIIFSWVPGTLYLSLEFYFITDRNTNEPNREWLVYYFPCYKSKNKTYSWHLMGVFLAHLCWNYIALPAPGALPLMIHWIAGSSTIIHVVTNCLSKRTEYRTLSKRQSAQVTFYSLRAQVSLISWWPSHVSQ